LFISIYLFDFEVLLIKTGLLPAKFAKPRYNIKQFAGKD